MFAEYLLMRRVMQEIDLQGLGYLFARVAGSQVHFMNCFIDLSNFPEVTLFLKS
jgi:hypothetical protein